MGHLPPGQSARQEGVPNRHPETPVFPHCLKLLPPGLPRLSGRSNRHLEIQINAVHERRPVIHAPVRRNFQQRSSRSGQQVRNIVAHQRGIVGNTQIEQQLRRAMRKVIEWRPPPRRPLPADCLQRRETTREPVTLLLVGELIGVFMQIPVRRYLVAIANHGFDRIGIAFRAPGRYEESLLDAEMPVAIENTRDRDIRAIAQHGGGGDHAVSAFGMGQVKNAFRIHVESKREGAFCAPGPGNRIGNHWLVLPPSTDQTAPVTNAAASPARNATTAATSAGVPRRPSGIEPISAARAAFGCGNRSNSRFNMAVSIGPGHTTLTRIFAGASSTASARLHATTAPLLPEYAAYPDCPTRASSEPRLTMEACALARRAGSSARVRRNAPMKLTPSSWSSNASSDSA